MEERFCAQLGSLYMAVNENWKIDENCNGAVSIKMVQIVGKIDISVRRKQIKKSYIRVLPPPPDAKAQIKPNVSNGGY